jgi:pimeloyl-ACP methyl ester carboxylesterase
MRLTQATNRMISLSLAPAAVLLAATAAAQPIDIGPAPGRLVDVGGRTLHINCSGSGAPTVIIETGASAFAIDWTLVQPEVARTQRVCSYDRAGSGWSDARPDVETPVSADSLGRDRLVESRTRRDNPMRRVPVVVLTRGLQTTPGIAENHAALAALSDNSRHSVVPATLHQIHLSAPAAVTQAIADVVNAVTTKGRVPARP